MKKVSVAGSYIEKNRALVKCYLSLWFFLPWIKNMNSYFKISSNKASPRSGEPQTNLPPPGVPGPCRSAVNHKSILSLQAVACRRRAFPALAAQRQITNLFYRCRPLPAAAGRSRPSPRSGKSQIYFIAAGRCLPLPSIPGPACAAFSKATVTPSAEVGLFHIACVIAADHSELSTDG